MTDLSRRHAPKNDTSLPRLIVNFISTFFVTVLVIIAAFLVLVRLTGCYLFTIESASMSPAYPVNSVVLVKPVSLGDIQIGDVVTYVLNESGTLVTHRVTAVNTSSRTLTTRGDANDSADAALVLYENVVGKVILCIPMVGSVLRVLSSEDNRAAVIAAIVLLLGASFLWDLRKHRRAGKEEDPYASGGKEAKTTSRLRRYASRDADPRMGQEDLPDEMEYRPWLEEQDFARERSEMLGRRSGSARGEPVRMDDLDGIDDIDDIDDLDDLDGILEWIDEGEFWDE